MNKFLLDNIEIIIGGITTIIAYFTGKGKILKNKVKLSAADVDKANLDNLKDHFKAYQDLITDLENRFKSRIADLEEDLERMKTLNSELRGAIARQEKYINKLLVKLNKYESAEQN